MQSVLMNERITPNAIPALSLDVDKNQILKAKNEYLRAVQGLKRSTKERFWYTLIQNPKALENHLVDTEKRFKDSFHIMVQPGNIEDFQKYGHVSLTQSKQIHWDYWPMVLNLHLSFLADLPHHIQKGQSITHKQVEEWTTNVVGPVKGHSILEGGGITHALKLFLLDEAIPQKEKEGLITNLSLSDIFSKAPDAKKQTIIEMLPQIMQMHSKIKSVLDIYESNPYLLNPLHEKIEKDKDLLRKVQQIACF